MGDNQSRKTFTLLFLLKAIARNRHLGIDINRKLFYIISIVYLTHDIDPTRNMMFSLILFFFFLLNNVDFCPQSCNVSLDVSLVFFLFAANVNDDVLIIFLKVNRFFFFAFVADVAGILCYWNFTITWLILNQNDFTSAFFCSHYLRLMFLILLFYDVVALTTHLNKQKV